MTDQLASLKLVVKAPNMAIGDQMYEVQRSWTVLDLKSFLAAHYPTNPAIGEQRIIYAGHLLQDSRSLADVFAEQNSGGSPVTVHLVCAQRAQQSLGPATRNSTTSSSNNSTPASPTVAATSSTTDQQQAAPQQQQQPLDMQNLLNSMAANPLLTVGSMSQEQLLQQYQLMQQLYADQFMQQMQLFQQFMGMNGQPLPAAMPQPTVAAVPQPAAAAPAAVRPDRPVPQPLMNAGAAGGIAEDDEEGLNRDWLDYVYWFSRALVFFSIVYFYSSFSRFIVIVILGITMYLYQIGWLFPREPDAVVQPQRPNDNQQPEQQDAGQVAAEDGDNQQPRAAAVATTETERFSGLRLFWVMVSSLFTSLIPEQIPQNM